MLKKFFIILILIVFIFPLCGCYDARGIETLAYVVALGIDKGTSNTYKLTLQIALLSQDNSSNSSSQSNTSTVIAVECSTVDSGISLINSYISKQLNLSHCKAVIISETLAYEGVSECLLPLINNTQIRPDCNIIISRSDAYDFLQNSKPTLESISARYYELILNSSEYTAYTQNLYLSDFYTDMISTTTQATAILGGINAEKINTSQNKVATALDGDYKAGETPVETKNHVENMGLAVFHGDKIVGELNNIETLCHMLTINRLKNATITMPNPFNFENNISLYIGLGKNTKKYVYFVNGTPYIKCDFYVVGNVLTLDNTLDLTNNEVIKTLEEYASSYLQQNISEYLYKTSKEFKSDIANFGSIVLPRYLTWEKWIASDWLNNYQNAFFDVNVKVNIRSGYLFTKF